ncbi:hypothetical protein [Trinickia acidisoli]|uniref:hypothetical protein n=1 Tax=Trinickia acidisoli TaxID=2767482 RepID=UPI001A8C1146|nr:hypothetical protein [Trinickia acidisoli]
MKGFYIGDLVTWCAQDDGAKLLGFCEREVCDLLAELGKLHDTLVDSEAQTVLWCRFNSGRSVSGESLL